MNIFTIVGARPQFIKAAAVSRVLRCTHHEILVHTGQHYDENMSDIFFEELKIPRPDYNLGVGSAPHGRQTGEMLAKTEELLMTHKPDAVLVYGDTNSTIAGALAAAKLGIPVAHVEAGLRSFNRAMPEEINRVVTDHLSRLLFCPTGTAVQNLAEEGIKKNVYNVGDVMCDALMYYKGLANEKYAGAGAQGLEHIIPNGNPVQNAWYLATIHRAENTDGEQNLENILEAFEQLDVPVIFPVHPRTRGIINRLAQRRVYGNIHFVSPVGYLHMIYLTSLSKRVVTDSGGLQKEAYMLRVPCVTVRGQTEWTETLRGGWNVLAIPDAHDIAAKATGEAPDPAARGNYYGDGHASEKICGLLRGA